MQINFNQIDKIEGYCPYCGEAYGFSYRDDTGEMIGEFSNCLCEYYDKNTKSTKHIKKFKNKQEAA